MLRRRARVRATLIWVIVSRDAEAGPCVGQQLQGISGIEILKRRKRGREILAQRVTQALGMTGPLSDQRLGRPGHHRDRLGLRTVSGHRTQLVGIGAHHMKPDLIMDQATLRRTLGGDPEGARMDEIEPTLQALRQAILSVRGANQAAHHASCLPSDMYSRLGALSELMSYLPQAVHTLREQVTTAGSEDRKGFALASNDLVRASQHVDVIVAALTRCERSLHEAGGTANEAYSALSHLILLER
jgi:hypothetical protein